MVTLFCLKRHVITISHNLDEFFAKQNKNRHECLTYVVAWKLNSALT